MNQNGRFLFFLFFMIFTACTGAFEESTAIPPPPTLVDSQSTTIPSEGTNPAATLSGDVVATVMAVSSPQPTPTLAATATASPPPATPVTNPPLQAVTDAPLPGTSRDLLFIADGSLKLWNHVNHQVEVLLPRIEASFSGGDVTITPTREPQSSMPGDIVNYSVSADGRSVVAARLLQMATADAASQQQLLFLDIPSRQNRLIGTTVEGLSAFQLSPDGQNLVYLAGDTTQEQHIYLLKTAAGQLVQELATCAGSGCSVPGWNPDGNLIMWADVTGLWLYNLAADEPELWLATESVGQPIPSYHHIAWGQNGRSVLMQRVEGENLRVVIFDVPTKQFAEMPRDFYSGVTASWMQDGRLLVTRNTGAATLELWRADPEAGQLHLEESLMLSNAANVEGVIHTIDGRFAYTLQGEQNLDSNGFYLLTSLTEQPEQVSAVPLPVFNQVTWSPDGSGIIATAGAMVLYAQADGDSLYEVQPVLGQRVHSFYWLP